MITLPPRHRTHEVQNQARPLRDYNPYAVDVALREAVARHGAAWAEDELLTFGARVGSAEVEQWGNEANRNPPVLKTHDRCGYRLDEVEYHPSYHRLMDLSVSAGLHCSPWERPGPGAHVARAAAFLTMAQAELGHGCPISMTYSCVPALRNNPSLAAIWEPRVLSRDYDPRMIPAAQKSGLIFGMAMTEKQGGSDVRANTTRAEAVGEGDFVLVGHKWFCSAPNSDAFLVLAQEPEGLSCFLLPRILEDGEKNRIFVQRLKDKLGNRSNASSEIELDHALAWRVGDPGRGVPTILEMANHTRLDCAIGSSGILRAALSHAIHHCQRRAAFGRRLIEQPLMAAVLADLAVESEAATALTLRLAATYDDPAQAPLRRVLTPLAKYLICKRVPAAVAEAMECLGGAGYVEDFPHARLLRESPLYAIWEGSGNVIALDVLRALQRSPAAGDALLAELGAVRGQDKHLDAEIAQLAADLPALIADPTQSRRLVERLGLAVQGALLVRYAPAAVADAFVATRNRGLGGLGYGTLPAGADLGVILRRVADPLA